MSEAPSTAADQPAPTRRGFQIRGRFYPEPNGEKLGDPAIVREVTGLSWDDYQAAFGIPDPELDPDDQTPPAHVDESEILAAMVALAVAHTNTGWNRAKVVAFVTQLDSRDVDLIGFDVEPEHVDEEEAALPPTTESEELSPDEPAPMTATMEATLAATAEPSLESQG